MWLTHCLLLTRIGFLSQIALSYCGKFTGVTWEFFEKEQKKIEIKKGNVGFVKPTKTVKFCTPSMISQTQSCIF